MPLSKHQYDRAKGLLTRGLPASLSALEKLAPDEDSLAHLHDDPARTTTLQHGLLWAAARAPVTVDLKQDAWTWLESKGLPFPITWASTLAPTILEKNDLELLDWLEERWGKIGPSWETTFAWPAAIRRPTTAGLDRLFATSPVPLPSEGQMGWINLALLNHKSAALPHVTWLLDHGVTPNPTESTSALAQLCRQFYDNAVPTAWSSTHSPEKVLRLQTGYMELWDKLIAAGANPHARPDSAPTSAVVAPIPQAQQDNERPSPWDLMMQTPAQGLLLARQRHEDTNAASITPSRGHRPRARS